MKETVKAVIVKNNEKSFSKDGVLTLQLDGDYYTEVERYIKKRKLGPGSVIVLTIKDRESKSAKQNRTYRLLVQIALSSGLFGDDYKRLHNHLKFTYGIIEDWEDLSGKWHSDLKSTADYTMEEMAGLITGTIELILSRFNEHDYYDKRLDEMMQTFNSQPIEPDEKMELF